MPYFYFSSDYALQWLLIIAALIVGSVASIGVRSAYNRYSKVASSSGKTGAQAAKEILEANGIYDIRIEPSPGAQLSDHFDPKAKVIRLSKGVYDGTSVAALGIAAHEVGHAIQYDTEYFPIKLRNAILPVANLGSALAFPVVILGILIGGAASVLIINIGIALFLAVSAFQLTTLPVEFNASSRALTCLESGGYVSQEEKSGSRAVLRAAAMTYVAGVIATLFTLLRLLLIARNRD